MLTFAAASAFPSRAASSAWALRACILCSMTRFLLTVYLPCSEAKRSAPRVRTNERTRTHVRGESRWGREGSAIGREPRERPYQQSSASVAVKVRR